MPTEREIAEAKFEAAVQEYLTSLHPDLAEGMIVDWLITVCHHFEDDEGMGHSYGVYGPQNQKRHQGMGLALYAYEKIKTTLWHNHD